MYKAYSAAETRLIVVDIDLLLRPVLYPEKALEGSGILVSRQEIVKCLQHVAEHSGNILFLLSSSTPAELRYENCRHPAAVAFPLNFLFFAQQPNSSRAHGRILIILQTHHIRFLTPDLLVRVPPSPLAGRGLAT